MSASELGIENWNPMEEDFFCPKFNSYSDGYSQQNYDMCSLYVKSVPATLTQDAFASLFSEGGKKISRFLLYPAKPHSSFTIGLVSYETEMDARYIMNRYNRKPPMNLDITYAFKKDKTMLKDNNASLPMSDHFQTLNSSKMFGRGRGNPTETAKLNSLKVIVDGGKRITSIKSDQASKTQTNSSLKLPTLISNPFLLCLCCKKIGELSCETCKKPYCSQACQKKDWPQHKSMCQSFSEKKEASGLQSQHKFSNDSSYMSEGSSHSDSDKNCDPIQPENVAHRNKVNSCPSQNSTKSPARPVSRQRIASFQKESPKDDGVSYNQVNKKLTFIKGNEIESTALSPDRLEKVYICNFYGLSKFFLHLETASKILSEMEKELFSLVEKKTVICAVNDVCCTVEKEMLRRVKVLEVKSNASLVEFLDYGVTDTVENNLLYYLPLKFKTYPAQAIHCNLVDIDGSRHSQLNDSPFPAQEYIHGMGFKARMHKCSNNIYDVSLVNDEGVSLYSILACDISTKILDEASECKDVLYKVKSVWSNLKQGAKVIFAPVEFKDDAVWGILDEGSGCFTAVADTEKLLLNIETETKETSLYCEEGELAAGLSPKYGRYYRCVVLKRLRNCFRVRYIDYGNHEDISKLHSLTPALLQRQSYVVCCKKPDSLSSDNFKNAFESNVTVSIKSVQSSVIELSFNYKNQQLILSCFPWFHGIDALMPVEALPSKTSQLNSTTKEYKDFCKPSDTPGVTPEKFTELSKPLSLTASPLAPKASNRTGASVPKSSKRITIDAILDKEVSIGFKSDVNIVFGTASKMYVHLIKDKKEIFSLCQQLNQYCNSETSENYIPVKDEIVCSKYFQDNCWYRGQVIGKFENKYRVFFFDFGNEDIVPDVYLKPLPEKFLYPKLGICVSLLNIKDADISEMVAEKLLKEPWTMEVKDPKKPVKVMLYQGQKSLVDFLNNKNNHHKTSLTLQKLPTGLKSEVVICYIDAEKYYFQLLKDMKAIKTLHERINSVEKIDISNKVAVNNVYCCLSSDGNWYRACVQKEIPPSNVIVSFIDFGNEEEVSSTDLKVLPDELFILPVYGIPVTVHDVNKADLKPEIKYTVKVIGEEAGVQQINILDLPEKNIKNPTLSTFKKLSMQNGINEVVFVHIENEIHYCHLRSQVKNFAMMSSELQCFELKSLEMEPLVGDVVCAKSSDGGWYRASLESAYNKNLTFKVSFMDYGNSELVSSENIMYLPNEFHKHPIFCIPLKIKTLNKAKVDLNSVLSVKTAGFSTDKIQLVEILLPKSMNLPNVSSLKKQLLPVDKVVAISFCHVEEDIFYAHMTTSQELIKTLEAKLVHALTFADTSDLPTEGDVICAKFTDGVWYRGSVEKICDDRKSCKIFFIDYGNSEVIDLKNLKILPTALCTFPILAVPIKFKNIDELQNVQAGESVFPVRVVTTSAENIQIVDIVLTDSDVELSSIEPLVLPESPTEVVVCHKDENVFYVQKISDLEKLQDMMRELQVSGSLKDNSYTPKIGQLLCVKLSDNRLYRGLIKEKCGDIFKAFSVDFGNTDVIKDIYSLQSKYSSLPMYSIPVMISNGKELAIPLTIDSLCTVKYTGTTTNGVQVVKVCPAVRSLLFSSLKTSPLEEGTFEVYFHNFNGEFYFLTKSADANHISEMKSLLENFKGEEIYHVPSVNEVLIVKCADGLWRRGCVKEMNRTLKNCKVYLIDSEATENISFSNMFYVPKSISSFPIFLTKVLLCSTETLKEPISFEKCYNVFIAEKSADVPVVKVFQRHMLTSLMRQHLPCNEIREVIFCYQEKDTMFLQDVNDAKLITEVQAETKKCASSAVIFHRPSVGELLCAQSNADDEWYRCCVEEVVDQDKYKIQFIDYGNTEMTSRKSLRNFTNILAMYPALGIAVKIIHELPTKTQVKLEQLYSCVAESEPLNNIQSVKLVPQLNAHNTASSNDLIQSILSQESSSVSVDSSSNSESEQKFFFGKCKYVSFSPGEQDVVIYSVHDEHYIFCAPFIQPNITANLELAASITEYCGNLPCSSYNGDSLPRENEMVLAKFHEDNQWYRAVVVDDKTHPKYDVIFIDYGNSAVLHIDLLRKMEEQFMSLEIQAHLSVLTGFNVEVEPSLVVDQLKTFIVFNTREPLKAVMRESESEIQVEIPVITNHLVQKKLALKSQ